MNKEIIKKYKECFDYWLNGGKVWCKPLVPNGIWHIDISAHFWEKDYLFVQDDEYAEFRKALANGKVIQLAYIETGSLIRWKDITDWGVNIPMFPSPVDCYRIKPDEPKFKVGDWLIFEGKEVFKATQDDVDEPVGCDVRLWKPKEGEWCVFSENHNMYFVEKFKGYNEPEEYDFIAPLEFIATLKDK